MKYFIVYKRLYFFKAIMNYNDQSLLFAEIMDKNIKLSVELFLNNYVICFKDILAQHKYYKKHISYFLYIHSFTWIHVQ
jgi:hypothetical protein